MNTIISFSIFTCFWFLFGVSGCIAAMFFKERNIVRCCLLLTAACCWLVWLIAFIMQLNPLVGPRMTQPHLLAMICYWDNSHIHDEMDP